MILVGLLGVTSCSNFTDIQPKGVNTLSTTDQLELLFNNEITLDIRDLQSIGGDEGGVFVGNDTCHPGAIGS